MLRIFALVIPAFFLPSALLSQAPLSAIDWLTESLNDPPNFDPQREDELLRPPVTQQVFITNGLSAASPDSIGLLAPSVTGFSANLWGGASTRTVARQIRNFPLNGVPEAKNLFRRILLAQANPTFDVTGHGQILQARLERLFEIGALDAAEALTAQIISPTPEFFALAFKVAILTDRTTQICDALKAAPALSNDLSTRVYCLARGGDWNAAAITLSLGAGIGAIEPEREDILIRYLDPELFEGEPDPIAPNPMKTMDFVLREAVFLPRPSSAIPLPYLYRDIGLRAPLRARIEASERLVRAGSLPSSLLFAAYRTGEAASSGGVWGRKEAVQRLDAALESGKSKRIAAAIIETAKVLGDAGLLVAMAEEYGPNLVGLEYSQKYADAATTILDLLHLANIMSVEWEHHGTLNEHQLLAQKLVTQAPLNEYIPESAIALAVVRGLAGQPPETNRARNLLSLLEAGNQGATILRALQLLSNGADTDPASIRAGLFILSAAGQSTAARKIAIQILLLPKAS